MPPDSVTLAHWLGFAAFVVVVLVLDLAVFHRRSRESTLRESALWTLVWCSLALGFAGLIWYWGGSKPAQLFITGYVIEWSLSMDNVFVFAVIFSFFRVPLKYQYRVLFWGILGAIVMRLTFILLGAGLIAQFNWIIPIFGVFLIYTGVKLLTHDDEKVDPSNNLLMKAARKLFPVATGDHGNKFLVRENGRLCITRLFLVLLVVESTDVLFAVDSVPAIFGITTDAFLVFTSNIFAILGLRALYFLLAGVMDMFRYLSYGLSSVLIFVGAKMLAEYAAHNVTIVDFLQRTVWPGAKLLDKDQHVVPPAVSLIIVVSLLAISIIASIIAKRLEDRRKEEKPDSPPKQTDDQSKASDATIIEKAPTPLEVKAGANENSS